MKSMFFAVIILTLAILSFSSCKKDAPNTTTPTTKTTGHLAIKFAAPAYLATDYADVGVNDSATNIQLLDKQITNYQTGDFGELNPGTYYVHAGTHSAPSIPDTSTHYCQQCAVQYIKIIANQDKEINITQ